jgi:formylglycine-generating enzyme required for sulfatase activity
MGPNRHTLVYLRGPLQFVMGSPKSEQNHLDREAQHVRRIDRSLLVATTETTLRQYQWFKKDHKPGAESSHDPDGPVDGVSWYDAVRYCNRLSEAEHLEPFFPEEVRPGTELPKGGVDRGGFRLPTEAEWEYICRAGTVTSRPFGETKLFLDRYAWTRSNSDEELGPAGQLLPNEFGLFDMLGSCWERCLDGPDGSSFYPTYPEGTEERPALDPFRKVPVNDSDWRFVRGGMFAQVPSRARSAHRDVYGATETNYGMGFRVVRTAPPEVDARE